MQVKRESAILQLSLEPTVGDTGIKIPGQSSLSRLGS